MNDVINWLLEDNNPAVRYRTLTEILNKKAESEPVRIWLESKLPDDRFESQGLWYCYYLTAYAECGLSFSDIPQNSAAKAFEQLANRFECSCSDIMLLRTLVKLGYADHPTVRTCCDRLTGFTLNDGGYLCGRMIKKLDHSPKSCYKASLHALMLVSELKEHGADISGYSRLIDYFLDRGIYYRTDDRTKLVLDVREGWRTTDTFYPFEPMRVGIQNVAYAMSALGYADDERLDGTWELIDRYKDSDGKYLLSDTLTKSYLPKERKGKPSKWVTFYVLLAKSRSEHRCIEIC